MWFYVLAFLIAFAVWKYRSSLRIGNVTSRHVFITGCDTGFGRHLAETLDKLGVHVYAGCLQQKSVEELQSKCSGRLKAVQVNVTDISDIQRAAEFVEKDLDGKALWAVVNNAGITLPIYPFEWHRRQDFWDVLNVNLLGVVNVTLEFLPLIKKGKEGRIINVGSMNGRIAIIPTPYTVSKYGVEGLSDGLSYELQPFNITTHIIEPAFFKTNLCNAEYQRVGINRRWEEISEKTQKYYGEQYRDRRIKTICKMMEEASTEFSVASTALVHALLAKYPNHRYVVGNDAKFVFLPMSFLPLNLQMRAVKFVRKLTDNPMPIPAEAVCKE